MTASEAFHLARKSQKRMPELENIIMQDARYAYYYARDVIEGRWLEAEPVIMHDAYRACLYNRVIIQGRWHEVEPIMMQEPRLAYNYAKDIIKGRWYEAEEIIASHHECKDGYIQEFFDNEPVVTKDEVDIIFWQRKNAPGYFAPASWFEDKVSLLDMMVKE